MAQLPSTTATPIRRRVWSGDNAKTTEVAEFARDVGDRLDSQPVRKIVQLINTYSEPMYLALSSNPVGITCLRVRAQNDQEAPVVSGAATHWVWDSTRAKITSIDGLSPGDGTVYIFTFEAVYAPAVG